MSFYVGTLIFFRKKFESTNDETYKDLKSLIRKSDIVVLRGNKNSSVVIMNWWDNTGKLEGMIEEGVKKGTHKEEDKTF